jgi:hypothetical protein
MGLRKAVINAHNGALESYNEYVEYHSNRSQNIDGWIDSYDGAINQQLRLISRLRGICDMLPDGPNTGIRKALYNVRDHAIESFTNDEKYHNNRKQNIDKWISSYNGALAIHKNTISQLGTICDLLPEGNDVSV